MTGPGPDTPEALPDVPLDVLLDVDTGVDDALALLFAVRCPRLRLLGVGCVEGNVGVEQVLVNTLTVLDVAGAGDVPVAAGAQRPLLGPPSGGRAGHGGDGLADLGLPPPPRVADPRHAVELLRDLLLAATNPVTVVGLGPATNLALLLRTHPEVAQRIARLVLVVGAPAEEEADFNAAHDPEALAVVLGAGSPVSTYGIDMIARVTLDPAADVLGAADDRVGQLARRLLRHRSRLGDAGALAAMITPVAVRTERRLLRVGLCGEEQGRLVPDPGGVPVDVVTSVAADVLARGLAAALTSGHHPDA